MIARPRPEGRPNMLKVQRNEIRTSIQEVLMNARVDAMAPAQTNPTMQGYSQDKGYMPGFGNDFETEALPGALPQGMNSP
tara:strand:+ start:169 stop:408 length:240 start_codon:yes stop_codon:yes gene_type:complete